MLILVGLLVLAFAAVVAVLRLVFFLVLLPFRLLGWGLGIGLAALGLLLKGAVLAAAVGVLFLFGLLPLVPLLLLGAGIYLLLRPSRARSAPA